MVTGVTQPVTEPPSVLLSRLSGHTLPVCTSSCMTFHCFFFSFFFFFFKQKFLGSGKSDDIGEQRELTRLLLLSLIFFFFNCIKKDSDS